MVALAILGYLGYQQYHIWRAREGCLASIQAG